MARQKVNMGTAAEKKMVKYSHGGFGGRTIIQRIEQQMDKRRKTMEALLVEHGLAEIHGEYVLNKGRYEGLAAALAILRSSSVTHEVSRSNDRLGIE